MTTIQVQAQLAWLMQPTHRGRRVMAVCEPLGIAMEGDTEEELRSLIPEAIHLLMCDLLADNEFDAFLKERGWTSTKKADGSDGDVQFDVPWRLVPAGTNGSEHQTH